MDWLSDPGYWLSRLVLTRALALTPGSTAAAARRPPSAARGAWWSRQLLGDLVAPMSLLDAGLRTR